MVRKRGRFIPPPQVFLIVYSGMFTFLIVNKLATIDNEKRTFYTATTVRLRLLFPYWGKLFYVIKMRSVDKNCLHMELCQPNKNFLSWSHLVKNVTKHWQYIILSFSLTLVDKWSRNRLEVSGQKKACLIILLSYIDIFLLVTFGQKHD